MKKFKISRLVVGLIIVIMLTACSDNKGKTETQEELKTEIFTNLTEDEVNWFNEQYFNTRIDVNINDFLNCTYKDVKTLDLGEIFYNLSEDISNEEMKALRGSEIDVGVEFQKLTVSYMDGILREYMNISFADVNENGLENYLYLKEFDAYFGCHGDTNYSPVQIKSGEKDGNGMIRLLYTRNEDDVDFVVTLKAHENGYYFVSNCEKE